jgi:tRNA A37 methylthiotransferase MiaB
MVQDKTFHIKTYGCQANLADSEKIGGILEAIGYQELQLPGFKTEKEEV